MTLATLSGPPGAGWGLPVLPGPDWPGVRCLATTRAGGVSVEPFNTLNLGFNTHDNPQHTAENRRRLQACLPAPVLWLDQVHGTAVVDADSTGVEPGVVRPVADAAVTTTPGRVLGILTADCLPVVITDADARALGVAHAGWRGLAAGVLEATLAALQARAPGATGWRAWVGPGISQAHFEVGDDVRQAFLAHHPAAAEAFVPGVRAGKWMADLPMLARQRLHAAGVQQLALSGACTYAEGERYYSYRRCPETGRQATLAWLTGSDLP